MRVDLAEHRRQIDAWGLALADARQELVKLTGQPPPATRNKVRLLLATVLNPDLLARWPRTATGQLSTRRADLSRIERASPVVAQLLAIQANEKLISSFGEGLAAKVSPRTGRLHAGFNVGSAKTGRFSSSHPNLQQIPARKAAKFRNCFVAAPGRVFVLADYSSMELRAAAEIADDDVLRADFANGVDLHRRQAAAMNGIAMGEVTDAQRGAAKSVNFGVIYGSGGAGLAASAWNNQRIVMSVEEATEARDKFFERYVTLARWMRSHGDECQRLGVIQIGRLGRVIEAAWEAPGKNGTAIVPLLDDADEDDAADDDDGFDGDDPLRFMGSGCGGVQQNRLKYTLCCNAPIQGACADAVMLAMISTDRALREANIDGGLVLSVHDELVVEVPEDLADEAAAILQHGMKSAFAAVFPKAPLRDLVKLGRGRTWASAK